MPKVIGDSSSSSSSSSGSGNDSDSGSDEGRDDVNGKRGGQSITQPIVPGTAKPPAVLAAEKTAGQVESAASVAFRFKNIKFEQEALLKAFGLDTFESPTKNDLPDDINAFFDEKTKLKSTLNYYIGEFLDSFTSQVCRLHISDGM